MNSITLNGVTRRSGEWVSAPLELTKRDDGTWHATKFGDVLLDTYNTKSDGWRSYCPGSSKGLTHRPERAAVKRRRR